MTLNEPDSSDINGNLHDLPIDGADFNVGYMHTGMATTQLL